MKLFRFVIASLLALVLVLSPALSYANSATATLPASFQMPSVGDIAKRIGTRSNVVVTAVEGLLGAVDWILDPENSRVKYKIPVNQVDNAEAVAYCQRLAKSSLFTYGYLRENKGKDYVYFDCMNPHMNQYGVYYPNMERTLSKEQVAEQIIKNAKAGHAESVDFVQAVANEVKKQTGVKPIVKKTERQCKKIKDECISTCSEISLPTRDNGFSFFQCVNQCLEKEGCL